MNENKVLIILGMHRSGTSLVANWINSMNLNIGSDLLKGGIGNIEGHFEDREFHDLHEDVLKKNGLIYGGLKGPFKIEISENDRIKFNNLVLNKNIKNTQWGWKDPRTCLFLDEYIRILPDAKFLIIYRDCYEVVNSLIRREIKFFKRNYTKVSRLNKFKYFLWSKRYAKNIERFNSSEFIKTWIFYNEKILSLMASQDASKFIVCDQNKLLKSDENIYNTINKKWGFEIEYVKFNKIFKESLFNKNKDSNKINPFNENVLKIETAFKKYI